MKKIYVLLFAVSLGIYSCSDKAEGYNPGDSTNSEVELKIVQSGTGTRATTVPYPSAAGTDEENEILSLDLIAFDPVTKKFVYTRPAYPSSGNTYRATVPSQHTKVDVALLANCPGAYIKSLLASVEWTNSGQKWEDFKKLLIDNDPGRLVNSVKFQPLPMSSTILEDKTLDATGVSDWGSARLLRSVASVDVLMERTTKTSILELAQIHAYYAPNKGHIAALEKPATTPQQYETPATMKTTLNTLKTNRIGETQTGNPVTTYHAVTSQLYLYDNNHVTNVFTDENKCTRIIVEGYYDQAGETNKTPSYYPIFIYKDSKFRPVIRNHKYLLIINEVYGPGYSTLTEAAQSSPINLNVQIIHWDIEDDLDVGASDPYYVSLDKRTVYLSRYAGSEAVVNITYQGETTDKFRLGFDENSNNGTEVKISDTTIENDRFNVSLVAANGKATLTVKAKGPYSTGNDLMNHDKVILEYRNLRFEITIHQLDAHNDDWNNGGDISADL